MPLLAPLLAVLTAGLVSIPCFAWETLPEPAEGPFVLRGSLTATAPDALAFDLLICGDQQDHSGSYYQLSVSQGEARFLKVGAGEPQPIGAPGSLPAVSSGAEVSFSLHRGPWRMAFIFAGRVVCRAYDADLQGLYCAYRANGGATIGEVWQQQVGDIVADDRFERTEKEDEELAAWTKHSGTWGLISLREDNQAGQMQADKTTNAFSYHVTAKGKALATLGDSFWRNCKYSVAARSRGTEGAFGLAFYAQDADNYLLLKWDNRFTSAPDGPYTTLAAVVGGQEQVLTRRPGGFLPDQWYQLQVNVCDEQVFCSIDGKPVLEAKTPLFGQGGVGLYAEGEQGTWFDDLQVSSWSDLYETFGTEEPGKWLVGAGAWDLTQGAAKATGSGPNLLSCGEPDWSGYSVTAHLSGSAAAKGLAIACSAPDDGYLFRWSAPGAGTAFPGKAQLLRIKPEGETVLAEGPLPAGLTDAVAAAVTVDADYIAGTLNGETVVDWPTVEAPHGRVGLYALDAAGASFDDVRVDPLPPLQVARITKEFTDDKTHFEMAEWASTRHNWVKPPESASPQVWRTKGDYYGPLDIRFTLSQLGAVEGTLRLSLEPDNGGGPSCAVTLTAAKGSRRVIARLLLGEEQLAEGAFEAPEETCPVSIERRGGYLLVELGGTVVIKHQMGGE